MTTDASASLPRGAPAREFPDKLKPMARDLAVPELQLREEDDVTKLTFPASSETPVERWFGEEILSHADGAVRMDRIKRGAMPLLFNHNWDDPIGMIDGARVENKRLVVDAHLFDTPRANEVRAMVDGGLRNVSLAYRLHVVEEDKDEETYTARDWEPYEVSIVTIPADPTVGIGRSLGEELEVRMLRASPPVHQQAQSARSATMSDKDTAAAGASADLPKNPTIVVGDTLDQPGAVEMDRQRRRAIENLCKANNLDDRYKDHWLRSGMSIDKVSDDIVQILEERGRTNPQPATKLGLTRKEAQNFSLTRAILASASNDWSAAGFELECSRDLAKKLNKVPDPKRFLVPFEVLEREIIPGNKRDLTTGVPSAGGYLVSTQNIGFVEALRNRSVAFRMGARQLSGLQGNVTIPKQVGAATVYWLGTEATQSTESQQTFSQIALTPHTASGYTEVSRNLAMQSSPAVEGIVTDDLAQTCSIAADLAVIRGSGLAGQPLGIVNTTGIGSVTGTNFTEAMIREFQSDVAESNVQPVRGGYATTPAVARLAASRVKFSGSTEAIWDGNIWDGEMGGFPAMSSNQMASASCLFGDWNEVVVGEWGVLEVEVNPYANFQAGIIGIRCMYSLDVGVRRAFAFSYASSMT